MTRRKKIKLTRLVNSERQARIEELIAAGLIVSAAEIPPEAIPVSPKLLNRGGSYFCPTYYQAVEFTCCDCGLPQLWAAEDQRWYYETTGAPYYSTAKRCRECRKKEQIRKQLARKSAGHEDQND